MANSIERFTSDEKRPRHYAGGIVRAGSRADRAELLATVPSHYRAWVADLVESFFALRRARRAQEPVRG